MSVNRSSTTERPKIGRDRRAMTFGEHLRAAVLLNDRRGRDHREQPRRASMAHGAEHFGHEPPLRIREIDMDLERAGLGIEGGSHTGDVAGELLAWVGDEGDLDAFPDVD